MIDFAGHELELPPFLNDATKRWISKVIAAANKAEGDINYLFCTDDYILKVNNQYLNHNYFTDIITFDYCKRNIVSGDLVISLDTVKSNSELFQTNFSSELHRVVIHGILHLLGYKDATQDEKDEMRRQEDIALSLLSTFH